VTWSIAAAGGGRYRAEVAYASPPPNEGSAFTFGLDGGSTVSGTVKQTKSNRDFRTETLGEIEIPAGRQTLAVRITSLPRGAAMNLHEVRLVPVR